MIHLTYPAYFPRFRCKCGDCRSLCCAGWRISLTESEYRRALALPASPQVRQLIANAFTLADPPAPDRYAFIDPDERGMCRLVDHRGFCRLHSELGEAVQPSVCRLYPRSIRPAPAHAADHLPAAQAVCSGSCEAVIELLMAEPTPLPFVHTEIELASEAPLIPPSPGESERRERTLALWQELSLAPVDRLAAIARELGVSPYGAESLFAHTRALMDQLSPMSSSLTRAAAPARTWIEGHGDPREAERIARERLPGMEAYLTNVIANHMFYSAFPCGEKYPPAAAFAGLWGVYGLLSLCTACAVAADPAPADQVFADTAAALLRFVEHTEFAGSAYAVLTSLGR